MVHQVAAHDGRAVHHQIGQRDADRLEPLHHGGAVDADTGARVTLEDGSWVLVRASSNKPELVVVVESMQGEDDMRALFRNEVKPRLARFAEVGNYNQEI